jgi:AraC-like DNA-binding protein
VVRTYTLHQGAYGRAAILKLKSGLRAHAHPDAHVVCWLGGSRIETHVGTRVLNHDDSEIIAVNPFEPHRVRLIDVGRGADFLTIYIDPDWLRLCRNSQRRSTRFATPSIRANAMLRLRAREALDMLLGAPVDDAVVSRKLESFIEGAIDASQAAAPNYMAPSGGGAWLDYRLKRAISFMRDNVGSRARITDMAGSCGLSRPHFFALFREQLSMTPQLYWDTLRLEEAVRRLARDDAPLKSIAFDLGFTAPNNFARFFRQNTGVSPAEYRRGRLTG